MTALGSKRVQRELRHVERGRPLVATMAPEGIYLREKGRRVTLLLPWGVAYLRAADLEALRLRRELGEKRKARRVR